MRKLIAIRHARLRIAAWAIRVDDGYREPVSA
jgi:hypothetical protein